jgi:hypothetical protein
MTTLNYQKAFAQILTDSGLRGKLLGGQTENFARFDLSEDQLNDLRRLDAVLTEEYSRLLSATRLSVALNALPFTKKLLPENFIEKCVSDYEKKEPPAAVAGSPTVEEVKRFKRYFENSPELFESAQPFLKDICRYEISYFLLKNESLNFSDNKAAKKIAEREDLFLKTKLKPGEKVEILHFEYDVAGIIGSLKRGVIPEAGKKEMNLIFLPLPPTVIVKSVSRTIRQLLKWCDGSATVEEICGRFSEYIPENTLDKKALKTQTVEILKQFFELGILTASDG